MRTSIWLGISAIVVTGFSTLSCGRVPAADRVLVNGYIVTMDERMPVAEALAIGGDRILAVGSTTEIRTAYPEAEVVELAGKTVMPGIIDAHGHLFSLGRSFIELNLEGVKSPGEVVERVRHRVATTPAGQWIIGWGWDEGAWASRYPTNETLNRVSPQNPVVLRGLHGFASWVNDQALAIAGITAETANPANGTILKDADTGRPTGILLNEAQVLVSKHIPPLSLEQRRQALRLAAGECLKNGITTVHEAGISAENLEALRSLKQNGDLHLRVYALLGGSESELLERYFQSGPEIDPDHYLTVRGIKLFADGALGSRGAALLEPYDDAPNTSGQITTPEDSLSRLTVRALRAGLQVAIHAIGDRGNRIALNAFERALQAVPAAKDPRLRIEHAQVVALADIPRFAQLGVIASMQPSHCTSDMGWAKDRIGPERIRGAYAWRTLLDTGVHLPLSSDFPGETLNPFYGMYAAETRQTPAGEPPGGWYPEQRLARREVLRGYTVEAAYAGFEEEIKGQIAPGFLADLIVLSDGLATVAPKALLSIKVEQTYVGGRRVFGGS